MHCQRRKGVWLIHKMKLPIIIIICTLLWLRQTLMLEGICDFGPELIISGAMYRGDLNDKQHDHVTVSCDILLAHSPYGEVHFFPVIGHVVHTIVVQFNIALQK